MHIFCCSNSFPLFLWRICIRSHFCKEARPELWTQLVPVRRSRQVIPQTSATCSQPWAAAWSQLSWGNQDNQSPEARGNRPHPHQPLKARLRLQSPCPSNGKSSCPGPLCASLLAPSAASDPGKTLGIPWPSALGSGSTFSSSFGFCPRLILNLLYLLFQIVTPVCPDSGYKSSSAARPDTTQTLGMFYPLG